MFSGDLITVWKKKPETKRFLLSFSPVGSSSSFSLVMKLAGWILSSSSFCDYLNCIPVCSFFCTDRFFSLSLLVFNNHRFIQRLPSVLYILFVYFFSLLILYKTKITTTTRNDCHWTCARACVCVSYHDIIFGLFVLFFIRQNYTFSFFFSCFSFFFLFDFFSFYRQSKCL